MHHIANAACKAAVTAAMALSLAAPALAQSLPSYASPDAGQAAAPRPSYAHDEEKISGRISAIPGKYDLEVHDSRGFIDRIRLHDGTVINPTGLRLATGMSVVVYGVNRGTAFEANEIDSPYTISGGYYGPYPGYYAYGPFYRPYFDFGIGIGIGGYRGWR
jgi:hypothetical protein